MDRAIDMTLRAGVICLASLSFFACSEEAPAPTGCGEGQIVDAAGACVLPTPNCGNGSPGSLLETCRQAHRECFEDAVGALCGLCLPGFVEEQGTCRPVRTCSDLDCAGEGRECVDAGPRVDASCGACLPGGTAAASACVPHTCDLDTVEGSLASTCAYQNRLCTEAPGREAACGGCYPGFVEEKGVCRMVRNCQDLGCAEAHRFCTPETDAADASCGGCRAGFEGTNGYCIPRLDVGCEASPGKEGLAGDCEAENRSCVEDRGVGSCGACLDGFALDPRSGDCTPFTPCSALTCEAQRRSCVEDPQGRCTGCLPGHVEDPSTRTCQPVRGCDSLSCGQDEQCAEGTNGAPAFCHPACPGGEIWAGGGCTPCPPCDEEGEDGVWPHTTSAGSCICKTREGFFYSTAGSVGSFPCDADGDGWLRESARLALESKDPHLRDNARCRLLTIDRFTLINESGQERDVPLERPLALYETDRNDDPTLLAVQWRSKGIRPYGAGGELVPAARLNRLTKFCHDPRADYNDNGIADVHEWSGHTLGPAMRQEQRPFNEFSYFTELYDGVFEPIVEGGTRGRWIITEKSRLVAPPGDEARHIPLSYHREGYWRECRVARDPRWGSLATPVGMDFARYFDPALGFSGMNHHSQFKCLVINDEAAPGSPQILTPGGVSAGGFVLNRCMGTADGSTICEPASVGAIRPGDVIWGAVPYRDYGTTPYMDYEGLDMGPAAYGGGCVNACADELPRCLAHMEEQVRQFNPGEEIDPSSMSCSRDVTDFGRFVSCDAWEICDGRDNDGDGVIDNGNPGGGLECDTGLEGVCESGVTNCRGGRIHCDAGIAPGSISESCNGIDDNCDGTIDETYPEMGRSCTLGDLKGACRNAQMKCLPIMDGEEQIGAEVKCVQVVFPRQETCADSIDHDCDGSPWTEGGKEDGIQGCKNFYFDKDGDGFADRNVPPRCLCQATGLYKVPEAAGGPNAMKWDCCDDDAATRPGAVKWSSTPDRCGKFDFNCDNRETYQATRVASACKMHVLKCSLPDGEGWDGLAPACGQTGRWVTNCSYASNVTCNRSSDQRKQACQ